MDLYRSMPIMKEVDQANHARHRFMRPPARISRAIIGG